MERKFRDVVLFLIGFGGERLSFGRVLAGCGERVGGGVKKVFG